MSDRIHTLQIVREVLFICYVILLKVIISGIPRKNTPPNSQTEITDMFIFININIPEHAISVNNLGKKISFVPKFLALTSQFCMFEECFTSLYMW